MNNVHIGDKATFNGYKLISVDAEGNIHIDPITDHVAEILIADGMRVEG